MRGMVGRIASILVLALALLEFTARAGGGFVEGFEDLPLAPGLVSVPEAGIGFDKPTGRIIVAYARGAVTKTAVEDFYSMTLPQLGWAAEAGGGGYLREGERLTIEILGPDGAVIVRYSLAPN